jgi:hypothetical protein
MSCERDVQNDSAWQGLPDQFLNNKPRICGRDGDIGEGVIDIMSCHVREEDKAGHQPYLPDARLRQAEYLPASQRFPP